MCIRDRLLILALLWQSEFAVYHFWRFVLGSYSKNLRFITCDHVNEEFWLPFKTDRHTSLQLVWIISQTQLHFRHSKQLSSQVNLVLSVWQELTQLSCEGEGSSVGSLFTFLPYLVYGHYDLILSGHSPHCMKKEENVRVHSSGGVHSCGEMCIRDSHTSIP